VKVAVGRDASDRHQRENVKRENALGHIHEIGEHWRKAEAEGEAQASRYLEVSQQDLEVGLSVFNEASDGFNLGTSRLTGGSQTRCLVIETVGSSKASLLNILPFFWRFGNTKTLSQG
jgi:hypothetical protein